MFEPLWLAQSVFMSNNRAIQLTFPQICNIIKLKLKLEFDEKQGVNMFMFYYKVIHEYKSDNQDEIKEIGIFSSKEKAFEDLQKAKAAFAKSKTLSPSILLTFFSNATISSVISFSSSNHGKILEACSALVIKTSSPLDKKYFIYPKTTLFNESVVPS